MMQTEAAGASGETLTFGETINSGGFVGLSLKNALLNLVTLTLYRFWGRTEVRRRVWSRVTLNDEPFEYTGKGSELFIGFLIATFVVGLPFLIIVFGAQFLGPAAALLIILPLYLGMFLLLGAAIFLAFRYMASRSVWRGVRFQLTGSPFEFALSYLGYLLLSGVTLGWYSPAMDMKVAEKLWGGLRFGNLPLKWRPPTDPNLYGPFVIGWIGTVVTYVAFIGAFMGAAAGELQAGGQPGVDFMIKLYAGVLIWFLMLAVLYAPYHAALLRAVVGSLRLGEAKFRMKVTAKEMAMLTITNMVILLFSLGLLSPLVQARTARFLVQRLVSEGEAPLTEAHQAPTGPRQGEGLADALGFSPI